MIGGGKDPVQKFGGFRFPEGNRFDAPELRLGVEACRLVGLDPDQLSLQTAFPESLPAPMDKEALFIFYDFPAQHWQHLRTTNPIESTFATVRLRTHRTKGCGSRIATTDHGL